MAMRRQAGVAILLALLAAGGAARGGDAPCDESPPVYRFGRPGPADGWHPYGGGLLCWWPRSCFPRCGGPDDYCRKPLPRVCWPPYPPYFIWGPPEVCCPPGKCPPVGRDPYHCDWRGQAGSASELSRPAGQ